MDRKDRAGTNRVDQRLQRRGLLKVAAGSVIAGGLLAAAAVQDGTGAAAMVPNNFHGIVHVTDEDKLQYAYSALATIAEHYDKAKGRLILDGPAVKVLGTDDGMNDIKSAHDAGAEIVAASDALEINGIDKDSLPDFIDTGNPGVIAVIDAQVKGYHYYRI